MKPTKKYYIEIVHTRNMEESYSIQSKWFDTEKQAIKWLETSFDYVSSTCCMFLMSMPYNEEEGFYGDIKQERRVL